MKICFLVEELGRSGGVGVVLGHARRLAERPGFEPEILLTGRNAVRAEEVAGVPVRPLAESRGDRFDIAVATWWTTTSALFQVRADRRAVLLQSLEERLYPQDPFDRLAAAIVLDLPVHFLVVAGWMRDMIAELRPDAGVDVVPNGIDKAVFSERDAPPDGPLRVLVEGQPELWFKGVGDALAATRAMTESAKVTVVAPDPSAVGDLGVDRVEGGLDPAGMAALYADHHVLVKLSRVESLGLAPIEAFHVGLPCVVTPYTGHEEYVVHGRNGLVTGFDDAPGTARWLDLLARDRRLLGRLRTGALATADRWPSGPDSTGDLAAALESLPSRPEPAAGGAARGALATVTLTAALGRPLVRLARETEDARAHVRELSDSRDECSEMLEEARGQLEEVKQSRAYRLALAGRSVLDRVRR